GRALEPLGLDAGVGRADLAHLERRALVDREAEPRAADGLRLLLHGDDALGPRRQRLGAPVAVAVQVVGRRPRLLELQQYVAGRRRAFARDQHDVAVAAHAADAGHAPAHVLDVVVVLGRRRLGAAPHEVGHQAEGLLALGVGEVEVIERAADLALALRM